MGSVTMPAHTSAEYTAALSNLAQQQQEQQQYDRLRLYPAMPVCRNCGPAVNPCRVERSLRLCPLSQVAA